MSYSPKLLHYHSKAEDFNQLLFQKESELKIPKLSVKGILFRPNLDLVGFGIAQFFFLDNKTGSPVTVPLQFFFYYFSVDHNFGFSAISISDDKRVTIKMIG